MSLDNLLDWGESVGNGNFPSTCFLLLINCTHVVVTYLVSFFFVYYSNNISLSALAFGSKKDAQVYGSQEGGVVGLNFHQSREALVHESNGSIYRVSYYCS